MDVAFPPVDHQMPRVTGEAVVMTNVIEIGSFSVNLANRVNGVAWSTTDAINVIQSHEQSVL